MIRPRLGVCGQVMNMSNETTFSVTVNGREYSVEIDDGRQGAHRGHLRIVDSKLGVEVTDTVGECNPLLSFWCGADSLLTGAARAAKIESLIKTSVSNALADLSAYRADLLDCDEIVPDEVNAVLTAAGL